MTATPAETGSRGAAIMVSYEELVKIRTHLAEVTAQLQAALALRGDFDRLAQRVAALETQQAYEEGGAAKVKRIVTLIGTILTSAIGGGALTMILPKLGGG